MGRRRLLPEQRSQDAAALHAGAEGPAGGPGNFAATAPRVGKEAGRNQCKEERGKGD